MITTVSLAFWIVVIAAVAMIVIVIDLFWPDFFGRMLGPGEDHDDE